MRIDGKARRRTAAGRHLGTLSPGARHVATVAAVLPGDIAVGQLTAALGRSVAQLLPELLELHDAGVLESAGTTLRYRHDLLRRVVVASIPGPVLAELRRELGVAESAGPAALKLVPSVPPADSWAALNHRERDVVLLANKGLTTRQIAGRLHLSPHTVNYYLRRIYRRLNINSRVQLAAYAVN